MAQVVKVGSGTVLHRIFEGDVKIIMSWGGEVGFCHFKGNVELDVTDEVRNAVGSFLEWAAFPLFFGNYVEGILVLKDKHIKLVGNLIKGVK